MQTSKMTSRERVMKIGFSIAFLLLFAFASQVAQAEGRYPPGQYPVGGPGVSGCAPIPGYGGRQGGRGVPVPAGEWVTTWGAIAESPTTDLMGISVGERSKEEAEQAALRRCASESDPNCTISIAYHNQCIAVAKPSSEQGAGRAAGAPTVEEAIGTAILKCSDTGGGHCYIFYSKCSEPIFLRY
jgi:hypothetical protein